MSGGGTIIPGQTLIVSEPINRQTIPYGDRPLVSIRGGQGYLTQWGYQFLVRLQQGLVSTIGNVGSVIAVSNTIIADLSTIDAEIGTLFADIATIEAQISAGLGGIPPIAPLPPAPASSPPPLPPAPGIPINGGAILVEAGLPSESISQMPTQAPRSLDGTELYVAVLTNLGPGFVDIQTTGNDIGFLILADNFAVNPLAGPSGSGQGGVGFFFDGGSDDPLDGNSTGAVVGGGGGSPVSGGGAGGGIDIEGGSGGTGTGGSGGDAQIDGGTGDGIGNGGTVFLAGGQGGTSGNGGGVVLATGSGGSAAGLPGDITAEAASGLETGQTGGNIFLISGGASDNVTAPGDIWLYLGQQFGGVGGHLVVANRDNSPLITTDPASLNALWNDNGVIVYSGNPVTTVATVASGSAVSLTTGAAADVTSITVANAGRYWISGVVYFTGGGTTTFTRGLASVGTASATIDTTVGQFSSVYLGGPTLSIVHADISLVVLGAEFTLTAGEQIFLCAQAAFGVSTLSAYGEIVAVPIL